MSFIDANSLADDSRVRRTVLAERHSAALRAIAAAEAGDQNGVIDKAALADAQKALAQVTADIADEYAEEPATDMPADGAAVTPKK
jgi:hypothetical protein